LGFSFSSCLIVLVEVAGVEEVMEEVSMLEKVVLVLMAVKVGGVMEGSGFAPCPGSRLWRRRRW
jgi:hypothetical protein